MKYKTALIGAVASLALAAAPLSSASAREFHHGGGGRDGGLVLGLVAGAVIGAVALATAPLRAFDAPPPRRVYVAPPAYYPPPYYAPAYGYAPAPVYYAPRYAYYGR